jgi:protein regulator of cytokinesis 1
LIQELWREIGHDELECNIVLLQLEEDCLNVYRKKAEQTINKKANLFQAMSLGEAQIEKIHFYNGIA